MFARLAPQFRNGPIELNTVLAGEESIETNASCFDASADREYFHRFLRRVSMTHKSLPEWKTLERTFRIE
ncbi:hypothetical protein A3D71_00080 [Candidatus Kaiserbacteria bacterium RIFCSPHIGHO2_02_FULL_55_20]|uniref:Uncharacterized protein n=1 Tax=Candidatus Kaiserbacteria bacterium RIFCSPHIGHO2_02_FULL_55_20 TaxID=1798497 RepID=A0A1F6DVA4_9BACT|nr:MAG: hypothetical protein A3D71_00080 [Candidatus Kaiserbacteria bacterium RIFCSPHIGHO2_02_FULL_55_20]